MTLHVRLSGRGIGGLGTRVLASVLHTAGEARHQFLLQLTSFLKLHEFDGAVLDLGEAVAMHHISSDQAVRNVRTFVQVRPFTNLS
ncbi:hypothetical protein V5799_030405 [Amblyomma americanum]|uniref:Uncharacterized protein n=1 Tax=Amblyomma americanum TaxID=6943 RepID=A0AAQ4ENB4_AMBAM